MPQEAGEIAATLETQNRCNSRHCSDAHDVLMHALATKTIELHTLSYVRDDRYLLVTENGGAVYAILVDANLQDGVSDES